MPFKRRKVVGIVALVLLALVLAFILFPDWFINGYVKERNLAWFERTYPDYQLSIHDVHYTVWNNRLVCDSVELTRTDSKLSCRLGQVSLGHVGWIDLFTGRALKSENFERSRVILRDLWVDYPQSGYELTCKWLTVSVPDSALRMDSLEIAPAGGDDAFFARSKNRQSRYRVTIPHARVMGTDCKGLVDARIFCGRHATIEEPSLDILVSKYKPGAVKTVSAKPNEILTSIKETLQVDSLSIEGASIRYAEWFDRGAAPAAITMEEIDVSVGGLANVSENKGSAVIRVDGKIMSAGRVNLVMAIPLSVPEFSFRYSGTIGPMDVTRFNSYLEPAQHVRLKSGKLQEASFDIEVNAGHATGTIRAVYTDLNIAVLDKETGSEAGLKNKLTSFLANRIKIRNDNLPDDDGDLKIGHVDYRRQPGDNVARFLWFALRSGVGDVAGF